MIRHLTGALTVIALFSTAAFPQTPGAKPPVILISIDTLRADHLSAYGYRAVQTPNIDSFAEHGTLYANASAQVPLTLPSHASMFTSTYPFQSLIRENAQRVPAGTTTLAEVLHAHGYKTGAFIGSVFLEKEMGLDRGFDFYDSPFQYTAFSPLAGSVFYGGTASGPNVGKDRRDAPLVIRSAVQWLRQNKENSFAFVHLYDLHKPYRLATYDAELTFTDRVLGNFKKSLMDMGIWERSIVIVVSDHGESLGEHGEESHGYFAYESTLHVPLLVHLPGATRMETSNAPVGLIDVAPTVLDLVGLPVPVSFAGKSLRAAERKPVYAETYHAHDSFGWAPLRTLRQGRWKYIDAPHPEIYDLQTDPRELRNSIALNGRRAEEMRAELRKFLAALPIQSGQAQPLQNKALLNSLGYLSASPDSRIARSNGSTGADPKDRLLEFRMYEDAIFAQAQGRNAEAIALLSKLLVRDPTNTLARRDLGSCYIDRKDYVHAREHLSVAVKSAADDYASQFLLGVAYMNLKQFDAAATHLNIACHLAPGASRCRKLLDELPANK